jgi:transcriptional regulator with XRE-family HTH domain
MSKIGANIKKIRTIKGLSQQAFAERFNLNRGNISSYEENRAEPKSEIAIEIAKYFSIPLENLLSNDLSVNEILQFNSDRLIEEEQRLNALKIKDIPYINEDILIKGWHEELDFEAFDRMMQLKLPDTSTQQLLALQFNENIVHHQDFEKYRTDDILLFRNISLDNIHLIEGKYGLYLEAHKLTLGKYTLDKKGQYYFALNDNIKIKVDTKSPLRFWKLYAMLHHE